MHHYASILLLFYQINIIKYKLKNKIKVLNFLKTETGLIDLYQKSFSNSFNISSDNKLQIYLIFSNPNNYL